MAKKKINIRELTKVLVLSGQFQVRRLLNSKSRRPPEIKALVVDIDGTLLKTATPLKALERVYGKERAVEISDRLTEQVIKGDLSPNKARVKGHKRLVAAGFTERDWRAIVDESIRKGELREDLVDALKQLHRNGVKIILATTGSSFVAEELAKRLGFDGSIGSVEDVDRLGRIKGLKKLLGPKESIRGLEVQPKLKAAEPLLMGLKPRNVAYVTDDYTDIGLARKAGYNFLLESKEAPWQKLTGLSRKFRLYDAKGPAQKLQETVKKRRNSRRF